MISMRLFVALKLPEETREWIYRKLVSKIPARVFKRVEEANLHITLSFIGEASKEYAAEAKEKLSRIKFAGFGAKLSDIGSFGSRVVWLGVKEGEREISGLAEKISEALGMRVERFHAHVTLARGKNADREETEKLLSELAKEKFGADLEVGGFALMESNLTPAGPAYGEVCWFSASTLRSRESGL